MPDTGPLLTTMHAVVGMARQPTARSATQVQLLPAAKTLAYGGSKARAACAADATGRPAVAVRNRWCDCFAPCALLITAGTDQCNRLCESEQQLTNRCRDLQWSITQVKADLICV